MGDITRNEFDVSGLFHGGAHPSALICNGRKYVEVVTCEGCKYYGTCCRNIIDDPAGIPVEIEHCSHGKRK